MGRQIVEHHSDTLRARIMHIGEFAHAVGEVFRGPPLGDFHIAPWPVRIDEDEQVGSAVAPVFAVITLDLSRLGRDRLAHLAYELDRALVEADHRPLRVGSLGIEVEYFLHAGGIIRVNLWNAPHVLAPWLQRVFGQPPAHGLPRQALMRGQPDQLASQQFQRPTGATRRWVEQAVATSRASSRR